MSQQKTIKDPNEQKISLSGKGKEKAIDGIQKCIRLNHPKIQKLLLVLSNNELGDEGGVAFGNSLIKNNQITKMNINLSNNQLTSASGIAIGEGISKNETIVDFTLNLSNNELSDEGCIAVIEGIEKNKTIKFLELNIGINQISEKSVKSIIQSLGNKKNETIQKLNLNLSGNRIGEKGVEQIFFSFCANINASILLNLKLYLIDNNVPKEKIQTLSSIARQMMATKFQLRKNQVLMLQGLYKKGLNKLYRKEILMQLVCEATLENIINFNNLSQHQFLSEEFKIPEIEIEEFELPVALYL